MAVVQTNIKNFLAETPPFNQLSNEDRENLASKISPFRYRMGQPITLKDKLSNQVSILYEGQVRILGYDPRSQVPTTLELHKPGAVIGWLNLARLLATETAIASTEVVCLNMDKHDFTDLLHRYPAFEKQFLQSCSVFELFDILGYQLEQQAKGDGNLKKIAQQAYKEAKIYYLPSGKHGLGSPALKPLEDPNLVWFVSGGGIINNFPPRSHLKLSGQSAIEVVGLNPARVISIPRMTWNHILQSPGTPSPTQLPAPITTIQTGQPPRDPWENEDVPYASVEVLEQQASTQAGKDKKSNYADLSAYPHVKAKNPLDASVACFQMLSMHFGMPFRKEVIQKVVSEQFARQGSVSLPVSGAIVELMGLSGQLVNVPAAAIPRLTAPVLVRWQESLAILYEITEDYLIIGVPEMGVIRRTPQDFIETWGAEGQALLLHKTKETPQERFGLRWFIPALTKYRWILVQVFIASFFVQLFGLANPLMIQIIIDKVIVQNSADTLQVLGFFLLVIAVFEALLTTLRTYLFVDTTNRIDMALGSEIIDHLLRLPLRYFERRPVGEISTRVNELENIRQFLTGTALTVVLDSVFSVVYIVVMFIYSPILTAVALGIVPVFVGLTLIFSPIIRRQLRTKAERNAETQSYLVEVMTGIQTVKAQNIELRSRWQWQERYARYVSAGFETVITSTIAGSASNFLNKLSGLLVLWVGAYLVLQGDLSLGQLIAFRIIASYVTSPMLRLAQLWQNFQETALSLERLADIVDHPEEAEADRQNIPMPTIEGSVKYENISFRFKSGGPLQLYNVSLEFPKGRFVAVVGESGAGKSTLMKLISRLYEPEAGRILIDGYDINKVELYSLRRQVGVVPQETLLFEGTVQENIALTNPDASTEEIVAAAQTAAAHEFIMNLPNGYNTRVGERGASLSGGQRQRIALARSVLQRPRILVLDEATSALDYATEYQVCTNLKVAFKDTTVFFITHRLGTIRDADTIVMMDAGSVAEQGTHEELIALKGRYYYLYQQQESTF